MGDVSTSMSSGNAITIEADNVHLDLGGYLLDGSGAGAETKASGIFAIERAHITIRNGSVRGFQHGVLIGDAWKLKLSTDHLIEGVRAERNTLKGIVVRGMQSTIRNCQVTSTGRVGESYTMAIEAEGQNALLLYNDVVSAAGSDPGGILLRSAPNSIVTGNRITGMMHGIALLDSINGIVTENSVITTETGITFTKSNNTSDLTGKYVQNITNAAKRPYSGGTAAGPNY